MVGGGRVATRKVIDLLNYGAKITIVSPHISRKLHKIAAKNKIAVIRKQYSSKYLKNHKIVFSATNSPDTNARIYMDCKQKGVLLNVADEPSLCNFILPANLVRGDLIISASSQGKAPFYSKFMRNRLKTVIPPITKVIMELAAHFRERVLKSKTFNSRSMKQKAFKQFLSINWEDLLSTSGKRKAFQHVDDILMGLENKNNHKKHG